MITSQDDFRISVAGAQEKTALLRMGEQWCIPQGATPTTHIIAAHRRDQAAQCDAGSA